MLSLLLKIKLVIKKKYKQLKKIFTYKKYTKQYIQKGFFKKNAKKFGIEKKKK